MTGVGTSQCRATTLPLGRRQLCLRQCDPRSGIASNRQHPREPGPGHLRAGRRHSERAQRGARRHGAANESDRVLRHERKLHGRGQRPPGPTVKGRDSNRCWDPVFSGALGDLGHVEHRQHQTTQSGDQSEAVFTNGGGTATTDPATLAANLGVARAATTNPLSQTASYGGTLTFSAAASGTPTPTVQWQLSVDGGSSWSDVAGLTSTSFTSGTITLFENGWEVRAVFTNVAGTATTNPARATVTVPPPTTSVTVPSNGATVAGGTWVGAVAQSPIELLSVRFEVSGGSVSDLAVATATDTDRGWIGAWDTTDVANGTYTLESVATDTDGTSVASAGVTVIVDNLALHTQVLVPSSGAILSGSSAVLDAVGGRDRRRHRGAVRRERRVPF